MLPPTRRIKFGNGVTIVHGAGEFFSTLNEFATGRVLICDIFLDSVSFYGVRYSGRKSQLIVVCSY